MGSTDFPVNAFVVRNALIFWPILACAGARNFAPKAIGNGKPDGREIPSKKTRKAASKAGFAAGASQTQIAR